MKQSAAYKHSSTAKGNSPASTLVFNATDGDGRGFRATNGKELSTAIKQALAHETGPTLIECTIDRRVQEISAQ